MSCYVCSNKHFNSIETGIKRLFLFDDFSFPYSLHEIAPELFNTRGKSKIAGEERIEVFIESLRVLNFLSVKLAYPDDYKDAVRDETIKPMAGGRFEFLDDIQLYKAMRCLAYQIEIKNIQNNSADYNQVLENAYLFLEETANAVSAKIVRSLPEYENAAWELDD